MMKVDNMADIRIPSADVEVCGRGYHIEMNMNVLADLQEQNDGNMLDFLRGNRTYKTGMMIAAALLNEAADIAGTGEHFDAKTLGRQMNTAKALKLVDTCINLLYDALRDEDAEDVEEDTENNEKN